MSTKKIGKKGKKEKKVLGKVVTWGYHARSIQNLVDVCREESIKLVIDVRRKPFSQQPTWNKEILTNKLTGTDGIPKYISMPELGNYGQMSKWVPIGEERLLPALAQIDKALIMGINILLMCLETEHIACHRKEVASMIRDRTGCEVVHLGGKHGPAKKGEQMSMLGILGVE